MQKVTLKEIADRLNVSISTVSRALGDHPRISPATKALVRHAIAEMSRKRTVESGPVSIGVYLANSHQDELFTKVLLGVHSYADSVGATVLVESLAGEGGVVPCSVIRRQVDGMIVGGVPLADSLVQALYRENVPAVFIGRYLQPEQSARLTAVISDNVSGGRMAARHLMECGYERFIVVWPSEPCNPHIDRMNGFMEALNERRHHISTVNYPSARVNIVPGVLDVINVVAKHHSVGVFVMNDLQALIILQALISAKAQVPARIGVIGYNGIDAAARQNPALTTIDVPKESLGRTATFLLHHIITGSIAAPVQLYLQPHVLARGSTRRC